MVSSNSYLPHHHKNMLFLTDSGMETQLVFQSDFLLREFSAFELLTNPKGREYLCNYYRQHVQLVASTTADTMEEKKENDTSHDGTKNDDGDGNHKLVGFVLESVLWRANPDWLLKLGYTPEHDLVPLCQQAMEILEQIQNEYPHVPMIKSGTVGPRSDGYVSPDSTNLMSVPQAQEYHWPQIWAMKQAGADIVTAMTMNYLNEGIGIALAAQQAGIPVALSFTLETNGCLPTGETLQDIIETVDKATNGYPAYYMINCAHPTHILPVVTTSDSCTTNRDNETWKSRLGGIRANASCKSHAELDECDELDAGDPVAFGQEYQQLLQALPSVNVVGGCCGTDYRHIMEIQSAVCRKPVVMEATNK